MKQYTVKIDKEKLTVEVTGDGLAEIRLNGNLVASTYGYWRDLLKTIAGNIVVNKTLETL